jgi:hypothetical protein
VFTCATNKIAYIFKFINSLVHFTTCYNTSKYVSHLAKVIPVLIDVLPKTEGCGYKQITMSMRKKHILLNYALQTNVYPSTCCFNIAKYIAVIQNKIKRHTLLHLPN